MASTPVTMPYRYAVVIADFAATSDCFHRRLAHFALKLAARICLIQHPTPADSEQDTSTTEILLEGLRHRLGLDSTHCRVFADAAQLEHFARPDAGDLVVLGASQGVDRTGGTNPAVIGHDLDCDVMLIEDQPDWD